jgi:hypothetical protein
LGGAVEEISLDQAKAQFETSFFGVVRMSKPFCRRCAGKSKDRSSTSALSPDYAPWRRRAFKAIRGLEQKAPGPDVVAKTIRTIISSEAPRLHYLIGPRAKFTSVLRWALPDAAYEQGKRFTFGLDKDE